MMKPLRLCVLCDKVQGAHFFNRGDTENAEVAQRLSD